MNTIVTRLTPAVPAAIATLGIAGPDALSAIGSFVRLPGSGLQVGSVRFATWRIPLEQASAHPIDQRGQPRAAAEHVVLTRPARDLVEVHCHGGVAVCQRLLSDLVGVGCVAVGNEHWPSRLNCPLAQAAEQDLQLATTDRAAAVLLDQMNGWADFGVHLSHPWKVVLAGPPNVGKSSLLNALAGSRQAIVHHEAGTTRDWIQWPSAVDGWPVVITDTAGVRRSAEAIERVGVERGLRQVREADLAVLVVDAQQGWTEAHTRLLSLAPQRRLIVYNKVDLEPAAQGLQWTRDRNPAHGATVEEGVLGGQALAGDPSVARPAPLQTSAVDGTGIDDLLAAISEMLVPEAPATGTAVPFRAEQIHRLSQSWRCVQAEDWDAAAQQLMECLAAPATATLGAKPS